MPSPSGDRHTGDAPTISRDGQFGDVGAVEDVDVVDRLDPASDGGFQQRPAGKVHRHLVVVECGQAVAQHDVAGDRHVELRPVPVVPYRGSVVHEGTEQSGKQLIEDVRSFGEQRVRMARLGGASSSRRAVGQNVSLDHRDSGEGIGKDSGGQQSADGCTENYGLPTDCPHQNPHRFDPNAVPAGFAHAAKVSADGHDLR